MLFFPLLIKWHNWAFFSYCNITPKYCICLLKPKKSNLGLKWVSWSSVLLPLLNRATLCMCVFLCMWCVYMCVCVGGVVWCVHVCLHVWYMCMYVHSCIWMYIYVCGVHVCACMCVCMYVCVVCVYVCVCGVYMDMHVWVCGGVWVYVCMYRFVWCVCMCSMCVCVVCAYEWGGLTLPLAVRVPPVPSRSLLLRLPLTPRVSPAYLFLVFLLHWLLWIRSRRLSCCTLPVCLLPAGGGSGLARPGGWASALVDVGTWVQVGQLIFDPLSHLFWAWTHLSWCWLLAGNGTSF